jgi:hypothetical protein
MYTAEMTKAAVPWQARLLPEPNGGCWLWEGAIIRGYGRIRNPGAWNTYSFVHRLAWEEANGPIPDGLHVLHRCDVTSCCNPDHLFLGTQLDNNSDMFAKGRGRTNGNEQKTHCPQGHPYDEANTQIISGRRHCRECRTEQRRKRYAERRV